MRPMWYVEQVGRIYFIMTKEVIEISKKIKWIFMGRKALVLDNFIKDHAKIKIRFQWVTSKNLNAMIHRQFIIGVGFWVSVSSWYTYLRSQTQILCNHKPHW